MEGERNDCVVVRPGWLRDGNKGLFALAGRHSEAGQLAAAGKHDLAEQWLADWQRHTGERLHLEVVRSGPDGEDPFSAFALHAAGTRRIPLVASNHVPFPDAAGSESHPPPVFTPPGPVLAHPPRPRASTAPPPPQPQ